MHQLIDRLRGLTPSGNDGRRPAQDIPELDVFDEEELDELFEVLSAAQAPLRKPLLLQRALGGKTTTRE